MVEALEQQQLMTEPADDSLAVAAATSNNRWTILNCYGSLWDSAVSDVRTAAAARTSTGRRLLVSFGLAAPPATSPLHYRYNWEGAPPLDDSRVEDPIAIAAHDGTVLLEARVPDRRKSATDQS
ncbi:hypothetical protein C2845_PM18G01930 [Panicum miliaceum]|uniref:Uncharacterized protein n=1 Tax=Panicum miliaceum TaxID=4540 RepID=A0A3L6PI51_PANMI|nr:hypothetical protein C2845_PM18G01930 [Panicum miliaceum]